MLSKIQNLAILGLAKWNQWNESFASQVVLAISDSHWEGSLQVVVIQTGPVAGADVNKVGGSVSDMPIVSRCHLYIQCQLCSGVFDSPAAEFLWAALTRSIVPFLACIDNRSYSLHVFIVLPISI